MWAASSFSTTTPRRTVNPVTPLDANGSGQYPAFITAQGHNQSWAYCSNTGVFGKFEDIHWVLDGASRAWAITLSHDSNGKWSLFPRIMGPSIRTVESDPLDYGQATGTWSNLCSGQGGPVVDGDAWYGGTGLGWNAYPGNNEVLMTLLDTNPDPNRLVGQTVWSGGDLGNDWDEYSYTATYDLTLVDLDDLP